MSVEPQMAVSAGRALVVRMLGSHTNSSSGNQDWIRQFGTSAGENLHSATPDGSGGVYVSGDTL